MGSGSEVTDGFGHQAGAIPRGGDVRNAAVSEGGADAGSDSVGGSVQEHVGDGRGAGGGGYCRRVGGSGVEQLGSGASGDPFEDGFVVGAGSG